MKLQIEIEEAQEFELESKDNLLLINGKEQHYSINKIEKNHFLLEVDHKNYNLYVVSRDENYLELSINGYSLNVNVKDHIAQILEQLGMDMDLTEEINELIAPMPGAIIDVAVKEGDEVKTGDTLLILEAMKMENIIKSPTDGTIQKLHVEKGNNVEKNQVLISF